MSNSKLGTRNSKLSWNCGREVRHLIVDQADDGSSPFSSATITEKGDQMNQTNYSKRRTSAMKL